MPPGPRALYKREGKFSQKGVDLSLAVVGGWLFCLLAGVCTFRQLSTMDELSPLLVPRLNAHSHESLNLCSCLKRTGHSRPA